MRTRLATLALVCSVMLAETAAVAQYAPRATTPSRTRAAVRHPAHKYARVSRVSVARNVTITVDGRRLRPAYPVLLEHGRALVPMRTVFQHMGARVRWEPRRREMVATRHGEEMLVTVGSRTGRIGTRTVRLDVAPRIYRRHVYVPARFSGEALGVQVAYLRAQHQVAITTGGRRVARAGPMAGSRRTGMTEPGESSSMEPPRSTMQPGMESGKLPSNARALSGAKIMVDGKALPTTAMPVQIGRTVMVPAQPVFYQLGAKPSWNAAQHRLTATSRGEQIVVTAGDRNAKIGTRTERLSERPFLYQNELYVPLDFVGTSLDVQARWEASRKEVVISTTGRPIG